MDGNKINHTMTWFVLEISWWFQMQSWYLISNNEYNVNLSLWTLKPENLQLHKSYFRKWSSVKQFWVPAHLMWTLTRIRWLRHTEGKLIHWGRDNMAVISQTTFSNAFSWMKIYEFWLIFHWSLFPRGQLTIFQHWFRQWLGAVQATSHYLKQWWWAYWRIYASLGLNELKGTSFDSLK